MTTIPIDYEILRLVWWLLLGVLLIGFAIMDGFDLGVAMLLPFVARTDIERRVTKGSSIATPRSKPSMIAKPISSTPRSSHHTRRRIS